MGGEKETPAINVSEVVAGDVISAQPGWQWLGIEVGGSVGGEPSGSHF